MRINTSISIVMKKGQKYEIGFASIKPTKVYGAKNGTVNLIDLRCVQDVK